MRSECTDRLLILNEWSIEAIITVAHGLGLRIVAEGVETEAQREAPRGCGCDTAQGCLLACPAPGKDVASAIGWARRVVARWPLTTLRQYPRVKLRAGISRW
ncbi:MAG: EAL domain-containing protein [Actinomycetota bacterium]|nr:EAL domain-containing protein [Actinomycetota bacterium]